MLQEPTHNMATTATATKATPKAKTGTVSDSQVIGNQAAAAKLGISIPGLSGSSSSSAAPSGTAPHSDGGWIDPIRAPGDTRSTTGNHVQNDDGSMSLTPGTNTLSGTDPTATAPGTMPPPAPTGVGVTTNTLGTTPGAAQVDSTSADAPTPTQNKYQTGLAAAKASGAPPPADPGAARTATTAYTPKAPDTSAVDTYISQDPAVNSLMQNITKLLSPTTQSTSLLQDYQKLYKQSGLANINKEIIDADTVINGTEDDIRNEIQGAGGLGTESQVQAMSLARNKSLLVRYNQLVQQKTDATNQLNTLSQLNVQDKQMAQTKLNTQIDSMFKVATFQQQAQTNIREAFNNMVSKVGYAGAYHAYASDPRQLGFIEQTMGLNPGGLKSLASQPDLDLLSKQAQIEASRANTAQSYSAIAKNNYDMKTTSQATVAARKAGVSSADNALTAVNTALGQVGSLSSGTAATLTGWIGGTPASNLKSTLKTIEGGLSLQQLAALKANSPNGASGLGAASDREGDWLASSVANLDPTQSPAQLKKNLGLVQSHYVSYLTSLGYGYDKATGTIITP